MKISRLPILFVSLICILTSCNTSEDDTVTVIKHGKDVEYRIHTTSIQDTMHVRLSDFASDFEFITLETSEESMISYGTRYYLGAEYILIEIRSDGIYQFARDGQFIRKVVSNGRGPREYLRGYWTVDDRSNILYISDVLKKNYFLRFDLKSGEYIGDFQKPVSCETGELYHHSSGMIVSNAKGRYGDNGLTNHIIYQSHSGDVIKAIPASSANNEIWSNLFYANYCNTFRLKVLNNDTIFSIVDNELIPYLTFDFGKVNPPDRFHLGFVNITIEQEVESWLTLDEATIIENNPHLSSKVQYYLFNKKERKAYHRGSIFMDPVNYMDNFWIKFCDNGFFIKHYEAIKFLEIAEKALSDPEFKDPYRSKLVKAVKGLSEEDNPVLLVGKYR